MAQAPTLFTRALQRMGALAEVRQDPGPIRQASPSDDNAKLKGSDMNSIFSRAYEGFAVGSMWLEQLAVNDDSILQREGRQDLKLFDALLDDDVAKTALGQRLLAVIEQPWVCEPGDPDDPRSVQAADDLRAMMNRIGWDRATKLMLYASWYGYAVAEGVYEMREHDGRTIVWLSDIVVPDRKWFGFTNEGQLRMRTPVDADGVAVPPNKFWTFRTGGTHDFAHYGVGLAHWCYWPIWFKRNVMQFWTMYLEKYGQPTAIVPFVPGSGQEAVQAALDIGVAIGQDSAVAYPASANDPSGYDLKPELLEATRSGGADSYDQFIEKMNDALRGAIIGQPGTSSRMTTGIGSGQSDVQEGVKDTQAKADSDELHESFNSTFPVWLTLWNHGPGVAPPTVYRNFDDAEDTNTTATRDKSLDEMGWRRTEDSFRETYGDGYERKPDPVATAPVAIDPRTGKPINPAAANDNPAGDQRVAVFAAGDPRPLYISRKVLPSSARPLLAWAAKAGFVNLEAADELHVTVCYSRTPVDWFAMPSMGWGNDENGGVTIREGGPRAVETFGGDSVVLMVASEPLSWRADDLRSSGASYDHDPYRPHITFAKGEQTIDLATVPAYTGELKFGPEIWEALDTDPVPMPALLPNFSADQLDQVDALTVELAADLDPDISAFGAAIADRIATFTANGGTLTREGMQLALLQALEGSGAVDKIAARLALPFAAERAGEAAGIVDKVVG